MSWKMFLEIARKPNSSRLDEEMRRGVTIGRKAYIADLMLFDRSSLAEAQSRWDRFPERGGETYRILLSELAEARAAERHAMGLGTAIEHSCSEVQS